MSTFPCLVQLLGLAARRGRSLARDTQRNQSSLPRLAIRDDPPPDGGADRNGEVPVLIHCAPDERREGGEELGLLPDDVVNVFALRRLGVLDALFAEALA